MTGYSVTSQHKVPISLFLLSCCYCKTTWSVQDTPDHSFYYNGDISLLLFLFSLILSIFSQERQETKLFMDNNERFWVLLMYLNILLFQSSHCQDFPYHETFGYKRILKYLRTGSLSANFIKMLLLLLKVSIHTHGNYMPSIDLISKCIC